MFQINESSHVFYVLAWGYAGDHWFSWFAKALNAHPEIFALMAHEGSRPKYLAERSRSERPPLDAFTAFLEDMGTTYQAIGDCWSYRPWHFRDVIDQYIDKVPLLFLARHPYAWLEFYVSWRAGNMRMPDGSFGPIEHEWSIAQHDYFKALGLKAYRKDDVEIWSAYQGMYQLNRHRVDIDTRIRRVALESLVTSPRHFAEIVAYLTKNRVEFSEALLADIYRWVYRPFRGEARVSAKPDNLYRAWPDWKKLAFERIVEPQTLAFYSDIGGYEYFK
ncbi:hypothetical protein BJL95_19065 [Methylomonas sp. LWB]|uniref:hypothetical protein n=1 Tax=Methylomonas sp. LWB TaxID=1905845 RepID=UPI0008DAD278|nr:hypothetical protein [Methylomonas sp. LWB]OHX34628.1 hypothetical protein BJL95_19065 [Methylomonas sp. LWB]